MRSAWLSVKWMDCAVLETANKNVPKIAIRILGKEYIFIVGSKLNWKLAYLAEFTCHSEKSASRGCGMNGSLANLSGFVGD